MKFKLTFLAIASALLTGCASTNSEYQMYSDVQKSRAQAQAIVEAARWNALAEVAKNGDATAKVAVAMAVATNNGGGGNNNNNNQQIAPPKHWGDTALQWTSLLLPGFTQLYGISQNTRVAITQSNNSTALGMKQSDNQTNVAISTNAAFTNMNNAGLTAANSIAVTGMNTANSIASTGMASITNVANTNSDNLTSIGIKLIDTMPLIQPNVTTTTTSTSTSSTTNNCGSGTSGGTLTCP